MNKEAWAHDLSQYIRAQKNDQSIPDRDSLTDEEEWQCRILAGEFLG